MRGLLAGGVGDRGGIALRLPSVAALVAFALLWVAAPASAAPAWLAPANLSGVGSHVSPRVAVDSQGDAVAVWMGYNGTGWTVQAASREAGGNWSAPVALSAARPNAENPQIALDARGDAVAVWERFDGTNWIIQAASREAGGAWSAPVDLSAAGQNAERAQIALDAEGDAVAVWERFDGTNWIIQAASREAGGAWSVPANLSDAGLSSDEPQVAIDSHEDVVVVWRISDGGHFMIGTASRPAAGAWSPPSRISDAGQNAATPHVAIDPAGEAVSVWRLEEPGGYYAIQAASRPPAGAWSAPVSLSQPGRHPVEPRIAIDPAGEAVSVWMGGDAPATVEATSRPAAGGWAPPVELAEAGVRAEFPEVGIDAAGKATALWQGWTGTNEVIQAASHAPGAGWEAPVDISTTGQPEYPQLAVSPDGDGAAIWQYGGDTDELIQAALLDAAGPQLRGLAVSASGIVGEALPFSVSPLDAFSALGATGWSFGDGVAATGTAVTHAYARPGTYQVTVTSADAVGNTSTATRTLTVTAPPPPGPAPTPPGPEATLARAAARAQVKNGMALLKLTCPASGPCEGRLTIGVRTNKATKGNGAKKGPTQPVQIGTASFQLDAGAHATVAVKLDAKGLAALKASGKRGLKAQVGGSGVKPGPLVLKAPPHRSRRHRS